MVRLAPLLIVSTVAGISAGGSIADRRYESLQPRQGSSYVWSAWENDYTNVNYTDGHGGEFSVDWDNSYAGDFVIGKGYNTGGDGM
jgi:endo-1,4-beta-xylanase